MLRFTEELEVTFMASKNLCDISLYQIKLFIDVTEMHSFSDAATANYIEQSTLSHQISRLEQYLGVKLFERSYHPIRSTREGELLYKQWKPLLQAFFDSLDVLTSTKTTLTIGTFSYMQIIDDIPMLQKHFADRGLGCKVDFVFLQQSARRDALLNGEIDIELCVGEDSDPRSDEFLYEKIRDYPLLASVLNTNPLSKKESLSYKDLEDQNLIVIGPEFRTNIEQWLDQLFRSNDCNPPKIIRKIEDPIGLQTALQSDNEAVLSSGFVRKLTSPVIKTYNLPNATCSMYAVWKRGNIHPKLHEAIEEIRQFCNKSAPT